MLIKIDIHWLRFQISCQSKCKLSIKKRTDPHTVAKRRGICQKYSCVYRERTTVRRLCNILREILTSLSIFFLKAKLFYILSSLPYFENNFDFKQKLMGKKFLVIQT